MTQNAAARIEADERYMRRALQLATYGRGRTDSNPMVGAVIVADGRIIGEGWHRRYGGPHAEVNAVRSVSEADRHLLPSSTIYVTLEPCSHYGKTPPCSKLLIDEGIARIVVGAGDPFPEVAGRGIRMLREAGREVVEGVLEEECRALNRRFMFAHETGRPYVQLKWAQSADGFIASLPGEPSAIFSNPLSMMAMHRERAVANAIMVGVNTVLLDNPSLTCRLWPGDSPRPATFDSPRIHPDCNATAPVDAEAPSESDSGRRASTTLTPAIMQRNPILRRAGESLTDFLHRLYKEEKVLSLMVEGGAETLQEFIDQSAFEEIRLEESPILLHEGIRAPLLPKGLTLHTEQLLRDNRITTFIRNT